MKRVISVSSVAGVIASMCVAACGQNAATSGAEVSPQPADTTAPNPPQANPAVKGGLNGQLPNLVAGHAAIGTSSPIGAPTDGTHPSVPPPSTANGQPATPVAPVGTSPPRAPAAAQTQPAASASSNPFEGLGFDGGMPPLPAMDAGLQVPPLPPLPSLDGGFIMPPFPLDGGGFLKPPFPMDAGMPSFPPLPSPDASITIPIPEPPDASPPPAPVVPKNLQ